MIVGKNVDFEMLDWIFEWLFVCFCCRCMFFEIYLFFLDGMVDNIWLFFKDLLFDRFIVFELNIIVKFGVWRIFGVNVVSFIIVFVIVILWVFNIFLIMDDLMYFVLKGVIFFENEILSRGWLDEYNDEK